MEGLVGNKKDLKVDPFLMRLLNQCSVLNIGVVSCGTACYSVQGQVETKTFENCG